MDKENAFELEWLRNINKIAERNSNIKEFDFFLQTVKSYAHIKNHQNSEPRLIVLGYTFPEEIIRAMGINFYYIFGSSFETSIYQNVNLPKDCDDSARSIIGIIKNEFSNLSKDDVVLVPLYNDNMKRINTLLGDLVTVISYEVPIDSENQYQIKRYTNEIERVSKELKIHFKKNLSSKLIKEQCLLSQKSANCFTKLEALYISNQTNLTPSAYILIANSYHLSQDKTEWTLHLELLLNELLEYKNESINNYPEILLLGYPVHGPNYKFILLLEEMQLNTHIIIHPDIEHIKLFESFNINKTSIKELAIQYVKNDITPSYVNNPAITNLVNKAINHSSVKGVIAQSLKGQIEYDFQIQSVEKIIEGRGLSFAKIETILDYHDSEQIRVRLEAFSEMLN